MNENILIGLILILVISGCVQTETVSEENVYPEYNAPDIEPKTIPQPKTLSQIETTTEINIQELELQIHQLINQERSKNGLEELEWNSDVANVARVHSEEMANYNTKTTATDLLQGIPLLYHEGLSFGVYHDSRLLNSGIDYFGLAGENIAALPIVEDAYYETYSVGFIAPRFMESAISPFEDELDAVLRVKRDIQRAEELVTESMPRVQWLGISYYSQEELAKDFVDSWMESPGHRENILTSEFDEQGIGVVRVNDYLFATEVLIQRAS